jgi:hypothetical protein
LRRLIRAVNCQLTNSAEPVPSRSLGRPTVGTYGSGAIARCTATLR